MALSLCGSSVANTGELACDKSKGVLKKIFIFNGSIGPNDYASSTAFMAKLIEFSKLSKTFASKIFPINEAQDIADNSEANTEGSLGLGFKATIREGKPVYTVKIFGGADLLKRLRTFNNQTVRIVELDSNNVFWGTKSGTNFKGYQAKLFFTGGNLATGQNLEEGIITFTLSILSVSEYKDNSYWMEANGNVEDIKALLDVTMSQVSVSSNVYKIDLKIVGANLAGAYDIWDEYGSAIAALTFGAHTGATFGTALVVTSVAADNTNKCLTVTFDSTAHTALADGAKIRLNPPTPSNLDTADVPNVEILPLIITKAA